MLPFCVVMTILVMLLLLKIYLLKKSIKEIRSQFKEHLSTDTNTLISISSGDKDLRNFTAELNKQLCRLHKQRQKYLSGDRELKDAVTNISHDLRTPLTAICGYLELLEGEEKSASAERYIEVIKNRTEVLEQLTEELFRYSVIITTEFDTAKEQVIINDVLEESIAGFYASLNKHKINPHVQMPENKVSRYLNRSDLSRVFSNLLNNTITYGDGDLDITLSESGEITFTNTASGLNEVQVGKLFDRFYTVEAARKSTGLGLAIARTLVEQMEGSIFAKYENSRLSVCILFPDVNS